MRSRFSYRSGSGKGPPALFAISIGIFNQKYREQESHGILFK